MKKNFMQEVDLDPDLDPEREPEEGPRHGWKRPALVLAVGLAAWVGFVAWLVDAVGL